MHSPTIFAGIDWAMAGHAVCVIDGSGTVLERFEIEHTEAGLRTLVHEFGVRDVSGIAIERPDGPVIDALLDAGLRVIVIASRHIKALRTRYGLSGNKDDHTDAYILADVLRTDGHRLRPLLPDTPATTALRTSVRARKDLVHARVRLVAQLRAHLELVFPGAVGLFSRLDSPIAEAFLTRFPGATEAAWLSPRRFEAWLTRRGYAGHRTGAELHARLIAAPAGVSGEGASALAAVTLGYVRTITTLREQIMELESRITEQLADHPDGAVFTSLPRSGSVRAATLLAPRSVTAVSGSHRPRPSSAWPGRHPRRGSQASIARSPSATPATRSCVTRSSTSPRTAASATTGLPTCMGAPVLVASAIPTRCASWRAPGSTSSGAAGRTACPTTRGGIRLSSG